MSSDYPQVSRDCNAARPGASRSGRQGVQQDSHIARFLVRSCLELEDAGTVPDGYSTQRDYMLDVQPGADQRQGEIEAALRAAFADFIEQRQVDVIVFADMSAVDLAKVIQAQPIILKSVLTCCNIAARAIERDLSIKNLNTYTPRLSEDQTKVIAGYLKPFLPSYLEIPAIA